MDEYSPAIKFAKSEEDLQKAMDSQTTGKPYMVVACSGVREYRSFRGAEKLIFSHWISSLVHKGRGIG